MKMRPLTEKLDIFLSNNIINLFINSHFWNEFLWKIFSKRWKKYCNRKIYSINYPRRIISSDNEDFKIYWMPKRIRVELDAYFYFEKERYKGLWEKSHIDNEFNN